MTGNEVGEYNKGPQLVLRLCTLQFKVHILTSVVHLLI